jgi:hypothetical protein
MHKQDFEKSVQQRLEELSFTPSQSVWDKVNADIRPRKKRRIALWLLPVALVIGASGWWLLQQDGGGASNDIGKVPGVMQEATTSTQASIQASKQNATPQNPASQNIAGQTQITAVATPKPQQQIIDYNATGISNKIFKAAKNKNQSKVYGNQQAVVVFPNADNESNVGSALQATEPETTVKSLEDVAINNIAAQRSVGTVPLLQLDNIRGALPVKGAPQAVSLLQAATQKAGASRSAWQLGVTAQYGFANIKSGSLIGGAASADFSSANPWPAQNGNGAAFRGPNPQTEKGAYWAAGITLQRALARGLAVSTGLQYEHYSQRQAVGEAVSRSTLPSNTNAEALQGNTFYRDQSRGSYFNNTVQQISVPLLIQVQPIRQVPLEVIAGVYTGYITAAKRLQYDTATRLYYAARPEVNRLQVAGVAALQYRVAEKGGWQLLAGPQVQYHFSRLNKSGMVPQRQYAYSVGLQLRRK